MAPALRPEILRYTFVMRHRGVVPDVTCFACGAKLKSNAEVEEGAVRHRCTHKPQRHADACGALYFMVAGVRWPWGAGGAFVARTTHAELSRLDASGLTVEQKVTHFLRTPFPVEGR